MSIRILIADDHAVFRSGLRALLEKESDFKVVAEAGDGLAAIEALDHHKLDVMLLDLSMPKLPGAQVAEIALEKMPRLAIVVLTMHEDQYYMQELIKIGARAYVLKKSTDVELIQAIRMAHRGERFIDPALAGHVISAHMGHTPTKKVGGRPDLLTPREQEICTLLAYGHTNAEIAEKLHISERTVESHRTNLLGKLDLKSRAELVRFAIDHGLLQSG